MELNKSNYFAETRSSSDVQKLGVFLPYKFNCKRKQSSSKVDLGYSNTQSKSAQCLATGDEEQLHNTEFHPWLWTSLALLCGFLLAIATEIRMVTSHYHFNARFLQAPGTFITNLFVFCYLTFFSNNSAESGLINTADDVTESTERSFSFEWITNIFYENIKSDSNVENSPVQIKILNKSKCCAFVVQIILNIITFWLQVESLYFATQSNVNSGVIMSLFSLKPIISFLLFYIAFGSTISKIEVVGMSIAMISVFIISISKASFVTSEGEFSNESNESFVISALLMLPCVFLICIRNLIFKIYYKSSGAFDEIFIVQILVNFVVSSLMLLWGFLAYLQGFRFEISDMIVGMTGGVLNLLCSVISITVVIKGKAGPADALVETSSLFLVIIEAVMFLRLPNYLQYIGIGLAFVSTLLIMKGSHS